MHVVIYSHGFPNPVEPHRNAFVKEIIRFLPSFVCVSVIAPVPFMLSNQRGKKDILVPLIRNEMIGNKNVVIHHPRYPLFPKNILRPLIGLLEAIFTCKCLLTLNKQKHIDLIHANWAYPDGVAVYYLSKLCHIPYVITEHQGSIATLLNLPYYNSLIGKVYRESRQLILVSPSLLKPLQLIKAGLPSPIIIPNAIDVQSYPLRSHRPALKKLVYIGNLIPAKGLEHLIKALAILTDQGKPYSLDIIGDGKQRAYLSDLISKLKLNELVTLHGLVNPEQIPELLPEFDLLVLPTLVESFGLVLIEAMAAGLPVLSTYSGGPEYIVVHEVGALVPPGSADTIVAGILDIEQRWQSFIPSQIRTYCQQHFDLRITCEALAQTYQQAVSKQ